MTTRTIDPATDVETEAFQTKPGDAIETTEVALQVAYSLRYAGIKIEAIHGRRRPNNLRIEIGESDFRRFFKGGSATEYPNVFPTLETSHGGVTVFCYIANVSVKKPEARTVQL